MRKEVIWAILAGITFGLVIAFGLWRINLAIKSSSQKPQITSSPKPSSDPEFRITLDKPLNNDVVTQSPIVISGITKAKSWLVISSETKDYLVQANETGVFEESIDVVAGINQIILTALDTAGTQSNIGITVIHSPAFEKREFVQEASESASTIRDKVSAKVQELLFSPKAYIGVVTDITESSIQLRSKSGEIKQISTDEKSVVVTKDSGTKITTVKFNDIAIGDFISAMGYINGNQVLDAQRILITPQIEDPKIEVVFGIASNLLSSPKPTAKVSVFSFEDGKVTKIKLSDIKDEQNIIYVVPRTIFALPQN